jgi:hypothetical protein
MSQLEGSLVMILGPSRHARATRCRYGLEILIVSNFVKPPQACKKLHQ